MPAEVSWENDTKCPRRHVGTSAFSRTEDRGLSFDPINSYLLTVIT